MSRDEKIRRMQEHEAAAAALQHEIEEDEKAEKASEQKLENSFEELLKQEPWTVAKTMDDITNFTLDIIKSLPNEEVERFLCFFAGSSPTQKKKKFMLFLKAYPAFKTRDPDLMYRRLFIFRAKGKRALETNTDTEGFYKDCADNGFIF